MVAFLALPSLLLGATNSYTYDSLNRLTSATLDGSRIEYAYDSAGNMTSVRTPYTVSISKTGAGTGQVTDDRGKLSCGTRCVGVYDLSGSVVLTASPTAGQYFGGWSGACSGTGSCVLSVTGALSAVASFDLTPPGFPPASGLMVTAGDGQSSLSWTASPGPNVAGYNVYRSANAGAGYVKRNSALVTAVTYVDSPAANGTNWYYVVQAVSDGGAFSVYSNEAHVVNGPAPAASSNLFAAPGNSIVRLDWTPGAGALTFDVYRAANAGGPYTKVNGAPVATNSWVDSGLANGVTYYYTVRGRSNVGIEGAASNEDFATPAPAVVLLVDDDGGTAEADGTAWAIGRSKVSFDLLDVSGGGSPSAAMMAGYGAVVWDLGSSATGTLTAGDQSALATYLDGGGRLLLIGMGLLDDLGGSNGLLQGYLHVSNGVTGVGVGAATGVSGDPIGDGLSLTLSYPFPDGSDRVDPDAGAATVFRNGSGDSVAVRYPESGGSVYRVVFLGFPIQAVDPLGAAPNNRGTVISRALDWLALPQPPAGLAAEAGNTVVRLTWTRCPSCSGYNLYRAPAATGPWTAVASGLSETTVLETGLSNGTAIYYRLTGISAGRESIPTAAISATPMASGVPPGIGDLRLARSGNDAQLLWSAVTTSTGGLPAAPIRYEAFAGAEPGFAPDLVGGTNQIGSPVVPPFLDPGELLAPGDVFYTLTAVDANGGRNFSGSVAGCSLSASPAAVPSTGTPPLSVDFSGGVTTTCGGTVGYDWDFGDGSPHGTGAAPTHVYGSVGTYNWSVVVSVDGLSRAGGGAVTVEPSCVAPWIWPHPQSQTVPAGTLATFSVGWSGTEPVTFQWYYGIVPNEAMPIDGATQSTYSEVASGTRTLWVKVSNSCGFFRSTTAILTVCNPAAIVTQPASQTVSSGQPATLSVVATGAAPLSYQWYLGVSPDDSAPISGATSPSYTTSALTVTTSYWVRVSNACRPLDSYTATVWVSPAGLGGRFRFDEGSGSVALDDWSPAVNGTVSGASWVTGVSGGALRFGSGSSDSVEFPLSLFSGLSATAYVEAWVRPTSFASVQNTIFRKRGDSNDWEISLLAGGALYSSLSGIVGAVGKTAGTVPLNTWSKVASWYDGRALRLFINDVEVGSQVQAITPNWAGHFYRAQIGNNTQDGTGYRFFGDIDEVYIGAEPPGRDGAPCGPANWQVGGVNFDFECIRAGSFAMGSSPSETGHDTDEAPVHSVSISSDYWIGTTEVTQAQWEAVMGTAAPTGAGTGPNLPVYKVSWNDICGGTTGSNCTPTSFIGRLNTALGTNKFRLPTEAEWEYAARGGTAGRYSFFEVPACAVGCGSCSSAEPFMYWCANAGGAVNPVRGKQPNRWNLYGTHGNVWEWVADWYQADYYASSPAADPQGPVSGTTRVFRGGSWRHSSQNCRSAIRFDSGPGDNFYDDVGFRLARSR